VGQLFKGDNYSREETIRGNTVFKFSDQESDLEYLFWQCKNPQVSSDIMHPLG
jgi:hypothetical protein